MKERNQKKFNPPHQKNSQQNQKAIYSKTNNKMIYSQNHQKRKK